MNTYDKHIYWLRSIRFRSAFRHYNNSLYRDREGQKVMLADILIAAGVGAASGGGLALIVNLIARGVTKK